MMSMMACYRFGKRKHGVANLVRSSAKARSCDTFSSVGTIFVWFRKSRTARACECKDMPEDETQAAQAEAWLVTCDLLDHPE